MRYRMPPTRGTRRIGMIQATLYAILVFLVEIYRDTAMLTNTQNQ